MGVSSPSWGLPFSLCSNLASSNRARRLFAHILLSYFAGRAHFNRESVPGWRSAGHSGKCILLNCCLFPILGLTLLSSFHPGQLELSEGVIYSHVVSSFCRQANSMVKKSRLEELS